MLMIPLKSYLRSRLKLGRSGERKRSVVLRTYSTLAPQKHVSEDNKHHDLGDSGACFP